MGFIKIASLILVCILFCLIISIVDADFSYDCGENCFGSCNTICYLVVHTYGANCTSNSYNPIADIDKNGKIGLYDWTAVVGKCGGNNEALCQDWLNNNTNPCPSTSTASTTSPTTQPTTSISTTSTEYTTINLISDISQTSITTTSSTSTTIKEETEVPKISLKLNIISPQENTVYNPGGSIKISGSVYDDKDNAISNAFVKIDLKGPSSYERILNNVTDNSGIFYYEYPISFGDPEGLWDLAITANDNAENQVIGNTKISVVKGENSDYYAINFLNPISNTSYTKGDRTLIQLEVRKEGILIDDAIVNCRNPSGSILPIKESGLGLYSEYYDIKFNDPTGIWSIACDVMKLEGGKTMYGGSFTNVMINPANIKIDLINPKLNELNYGKDTNFTINLTYPNNEPVLSAMGSLSFQGQNLVLLEIGMGVYRTSLQAKNTGRFNVNISAKDLNENTGNLEKTFTVKATMLGFLYINWFVLPLSLGSLVSLIYTFRFFRMRVPAQINNLEKRLHQINEMRITAEKEYFMRKIDEKTFKNLMENYKQKKLESQVMLAELRKKLKTSSEQNN
jgi:hypothetical protein